MALPQRQQKQQPRLPVNAERELALLEEQFGGRQNLVQALTFAKQTKDVRYLLGLIADPEHNARSLAEICHMGRILPGELVAALASGADLRSQLLAKQHIAQRAPAVVAEVMQKAAEYEDDCSECQGLGMLTPDPTDDNKNPEPGQCATCKGTGRLRYPADGKCRDLALEMAGLVGGTGGGSVINVNQNVQMANFQGGSYEGFERMQEAMDAVLFGAGAVPNLQGKSAEAEAVDGEVVPERAEGAEAP